MGSRDRNELAVLDAVERRWIEKTSMELLDHLPSWRRNCPLTLERFAKRFRGLPLCGADGAIANLCADVVESEAMRLRNRRLH